MIIFCSDIFEYTSFICIYQEFPYSYFTIEFFDFLENTMFIKKMLLK